MRADQFYQRVANHLGTDRAKAKEITLHTLESFSHRLTQEVAEELASQLPRDMEHGLQWTEYDAHFDKQRFLDCLLQVNDATVQQKQTATLADEAVAKRMQSVFSTIKQCVQPSTVLHLAASLPEGIETWFIDAADVADTPPRE